MIGETELELAIAEANVLVGAGDTLQYAHAAIDIGPVDHYARRFAQVKEAADATFSEAAAGGFLLGFRLGVLAARHESREV